ncbi:28S ribosomal protein S31, mitochondrial [Astyanax mexicanus]|uniref:Small ribosomal subunit protein mS31 n=1 Tax=Astyanax mexicanus TaxID=7994 RepID=A0A8T2MHS8_ASTMX|nr:28S ribosomal protein S31, mitochondrial [Astyanax mexicanus]
MYRRAIISLFPRRPALTPSPEHTCTLPLRAHRAVVQVSCRAFGSTGVILCEKKDRTSSPPSVNVKNDEGRSKNPENAEPTEPEPRTEHRTEPKSNKKALLELLGGMKVEVTTKRKPPPRPKEMNLTIGEDTEHSESLSEDLVAAAAAAASTLPDGSRAKSELLRQLRKHESVYAHDKKRDTPNIQNIIADMTVRKTSGRQNNRPTNQIECDEDDQAYPGDHGNARERDRRRKIMADIQYSDQGNANNRGITGELERLRRSRLFYTRRLNIFPIGKNQKTDNELAAGPSLWDADLASRISKALNNQPRNGFEEMIQWTREGKMWQYPIDNEAGMDEEAGVPFHEHVFLERHLVDGFPQQGPVRHFMELVVTGLSKNHQLSVQQKLEHIAWFRDYFQQKQDVLKEAEAY